MRKLKRVNGFIRRAEIPVSYLEELIKDRIELNDKNSFPRDTRDFSSEQIKMLADSIVVRNPTIKDWLVVRMHEKDIPTITVQVETDSAFSIGFADNWVLCQVVVHIGKGAI